MGTPESKLCFRCRLVKPLTDFYSDKYRDDGRACYCAPCSREYTRERAKLPRVKAVRAAWAATKGKVAVIRYKERWPAKKRAREIVTREVNAGRMVNPRACSQCSDTERVEAHHDDYAMPFEVRWLCRLCHRAWHREHGHARNSDLMVPRE